MNEWQAFMRYWSRMTRRSQDRMRQQLLNNLYDYNPGEIDRWADDGGVEVQINVNYNQT